MKLKSIVFVLLLALIIHGNVWAAVSREQVAKLYVATFNRAPDAGGLNHWVNSGLTINQIAEEFFKAPETQKKYPEGTTYNQFVNAIYQNVFGRDAEQNGLEYWVNVLDNGWSTRPQMIMTVIEGAQNKDLQVLVNKTEVGLYYVDEIGMNHIDGYKFSLADITDDIATAINGKMAVDLIAANTGSLVNKIEYYMAMITSAGELSPMMDEISVLLGTILSGDSSVVTITPPLASIDPYYPPSTINITANFGSGYTPEGSTSVYTGTTVINITNISFAGTNLTANAALTATDVRRDGELVLNGNMTFGINVGMAGGNTSVTATAGFTNLSSMDALINGSIALSIPSINDNGQLTQPATLTLNQFTAMDYQMNGTVTMSQPSAEIFDVKFNLTTNEGPVIGLLRAQTQTDPVEMDLIQTILSTPSAPMTVGDASVTISQVVMDPDVCEDLPASGNILITRGDESATISFSGCAYTVN